MPSRLCARLRRAGIRLPSAGSAHATLLAACCMSLRLWRDCGRIVESRSCRCNLTPIHAIWSLNSLCPRVRAGCCQSATQAPPPRRRLLVALSSRRAAAPQPLVYGEFPRISDASSCVVHPGSPMLGPPPPPDGGPHLSPEERRG